MLDADRGQIVNHEIAPDDDPYQVKIDDAKLRTAKRAELFHSHPDDSPPSGEDYRAMLENENVTRSEVLTAGHQYTIEKTENWSHEGKTAVRRSDLHFYAEMNEEKRRRGLRSVPDRDLTVRQMQELLDHANVKTSKHYGLTLKKEARP